MSKVEYKVATLTGDKVKATFPGLGRNQDGTGARTGDASSWEIGSILGSIKLKGWDDAAGPMPLYREGDAHPRIGNRRLTAVALLVDQQPGVYGPMKIKVRVYPADTPDEVMDEIVAAEIRSTKAHTRRDLVKLGCVHKQRNPGSTQRQTAEHIGLDLLKGFNSFKDGALETGPDGVTRIKAGLPDSKVFRQKDIIMEAHAAARALDEVRRLFLDPTEAKYLNADELYAANQAMDADVKRKPSLANASTLAEFAEALPDSALVAQVGPVIAEGRQTKPGSTPGGKRAMSKATLLQVQKTLGRFKPVGCLFALVNGLPGANDEAALEAVTGMVELLAKVANPATGGEELDKLRVELASRADAFLARVDAAQAEINAKLAKPEA